MMNISKQNSIASKKLAASVFALALPTMVEELMGTAVQYIDTAMIGSLGTLATAAVGSTTTVNWLIGSTTHAIGIGFLSYISRSLGAGSEERAKKAAGQSAFMVLLSGLFFTILTLSLSRKVPVWMNVDASVQSIAAQYFFILYTPMLFRAAENIFGTVLRAAGDSRTPMRIGIGVNVINVILNFFLIYNTRDVSLFGLTFRMPGAGWGVAGAAAASAIAYSYGGIAVTAALFRHRTVSPKGYPILPDGKILKPCMRIAFPNMMQRFCTCLGYVVFAGMINSLGAVSTAAHTIANTVESAFYIPGYGMQSAAATLTGNAIGAGDEEKRKATGRTILLLEVGMMLLSGALLFFFARQMAGLFTRDAQVILLSATVLRMVSLSEPFYGISIVTEGMLLGAGKTTAPFVFSVCSMWLVRIAGTFVCTRIFGLGLVSAWACMIANNMLLMLLFRIYYRRTKWMAE